MFRKVDDKVGLWMLNKYKLIDYIIDHKINNYQLEENILPSLSSARQSKRIVNYINSVNQVGDKKLNVFQYKVQQNKPFSDF